MFRRERERERERERRKDVSKYYHTHTQEKRERERKTVLAYPSRRHRLELLQNLPFLLFFFLCGFSLWATQKSFAASLALSLSVVGSSPVSSLSLFFWFPGDLETHTNTKTHNSAQQTHASFTLFLYVTCARARFEDFRRARARGQTHTH